MSRPDDIDTRLVELVRELERCGDEMDLAAAVGVATGPDGSHDTDRRMPPIVRQAQINRCEQILRGGQS